MSKNSISVFIHRVGSLLSSIVILYIVTAWLSSEQQGAYYLILSLVGLQAFVDFGVLSVMNNLILRVWTDYLNSNDSLYRENRIAVLRGYFYFFSRWYIIFSVVLFIFSLVYALNFRGDKNLFKVLVSIGLFSSLNFFLNLFWLFLEGLGEYYSLYMFRTLQSVLSVVLLTVSVHFGYELYSFLILYAVQFFLGTFFVAFKCSKLRRFLNGPRTKFLYFKEVFPFHSKIFVQSVFGYLTWQALVPLVFKETGAILAGKLGFTIQLSTLILSFSSFLIYSKSPLYSKLYSESSYELLFRTWTVDLKKTYSFFFLIVIVYFCIVHLDFSVTKIILNRGMSFFQTIIIFAIHAIYVFNQSVAILTRLNKVEVLTLGGIAVPILTYLLFFTFLPYLSLTILLTLILFLNLGFLVINYMKFISFRLNFN